MHKKMILLTLASNNKGTMIPKDNIDFVIEIEGEDENKKKEVFTRIYLKHSPLEDAWVDVKESAEYIMRKI